MRSVRFFALLAVSAAAALAWAPAASAEVTSFLGADLSGAKEVPPSDPALTGDAAVSLDTASGEVCYNVAAQVTSPTGMHIHRGEAGVVGPIVVNLDVTKLNSPDPACTQSTPQLAWEIQNNPTGFYVNVHTTTYPNGAVRGQLGTGVLWVPLSGAQEVPPVATASTGDVILVFPSPTQICAEVDTTISTATGMHIHRGERGTNGPVVVPFDAGRLSGEQCVTVSAELGTEIATNPAGFYFNIHTPANPGGELRGQLAFSMQAAAPTTTPTTAPTSPPAPEPLETGGASVVMPRGVNAGSGGQAAGGAEVPMLFVAAGVAVAVGAAGVPALVAVRRRRASAAVEA